MTLSQGVAVALVPARVVNDGSRDWLASCGKTQLAVAFAESFWQSGGVDLLVWIVATNRASVLSGLVEAAVAAMGADPAGDAELIATRFLSWLRETDRPWLVVLDDLSDPADLDPLWPEGPRGMVVITARDPAIVAAGRRAAVLPVGAFSPREALSYLRGRLTADPDQRLGAIDLIEELGYEPLALAQATVVIVGSALSCQDYRGYFARRREQFAKAADSEPPAASVTWTFSLEQADRLLPGGIGRSLLALAALLDGHGIPGTLFTTTAVSTYLGGNRAAAPQDPEQIRNALLVLEQAGLLAIDLGATPPTVRMKSVIQAAVRAVMPAGVFERAARTAADALLEVWPGDGPLAWLAAEARRCADSLQKAAGDLLWAGSCHPVLLRAGESLDSARLAGPAVAHWRGLAAVSQRVQGPSHPDTVLIGQHLADAYLRAGRAAEACPWLQWILADRVRVLGPDHPAAIAARRNLGHALAAADQVRDALTILAGAVGDYERVRGANHVDTLGARDELAAAYRAAGQFDEAIRLYRRTLADRERIQGSQSLDTIATRQQLADAYLADGRLKEALSNYKRVLSDRERALGPDHLDTIEARGNLGAAYHSAGRMASALQLYEQTHASYERVLGAEHPDSLAYSTSLATAYYRVGRLSEAMTLLRDTLARCELVLPAGDPLTQAVRASLKNIAGG
jgi:tetratricopeptide (TPR) repeat protein